MPLKMTERNGKTTTDPNRRFMRRARRPHLSAGSVVLLTGLAFLTLFSLLLFSGAIGGTLVYSLQHFFCAWLGVGRYFFTLISLAILIVFIRSLLGKTVPPLSLSVGFGSVSLLFALLTVIAGVDAGVGGKIGTLLHEVLRVRFGKFGAVVVLFIWTGLSIALVIRFDVCRISLSRWADRIRKLKRSEDNPKPESVSLNSVGSDENQQETRLEAAADDAEAAAEPISITAADDQELEEDLGNRIYKNKVPPLNLLEPELGFINRDYDLTDTIEAIKVAMDELETPVEFVSYCIGPAIIQYQVQPGSRRGANGEGSSRQIRVGDVARVERDLAVQLGEKNLAIQAPVPGKAYIGIDLPNPNALIVRLRPLMESKIFREMKSPLRVALGRDITGMPVVVDLEQMPHLLIAGTTNSGKSICMRSIALCLLMNNSPEDLRVIMIDPKRVELFRFNGVPHLYGSVETEFERSLAVLNWAVYEMNERYKLFQNEGQGINKIAAYNKLALSRGDKPLPRIVIFVDEVAEIMNGPDRSGVEAINKLASLSRATGIHLILATQRPDATVITGDIKTNIPARIALNVASGVDSRVIMGKQGAEKLLGRGDMYLIQPSQQTPLRIQGPMLMDSEIDAVVNFWRKLAPRSEAEEEAGAPWEAEIARQEEEELHDKVFRDAVKAVCATGRATTNFLQTKLRISFPRAKRILSRMEDLGIVGPSQAGGRQREVLWSADEADHLDEKIGITEE